jgi:hypothetical protein
MQIEFTKDTVVKGSVRKVGDVLELDDRQAQRLIQKGVAKAKQTAAAAAGRRALSSTATETKPES